MYAIFFKRVMTVVVGTIIVLTGCVTQKTQSTSVQNAVYILEAVKDMPTGGVFSFKDYCAFNAERGGPDSDLDRTLADANARMELHFAVGTAELTLVSSSGDNSAAFLEYQKRYASQFFFIEHENTVEFTLNIATLDKETRASIEGMSAMEWDAVLKSVFEKSKDMLIEPDEEDNVINYWRRTR